MLFRSFKTKWLPSVGYISAQEAHRSIRTDRTITS